MTNLSDKPPDVNTDWTTRLSPSLTRQFGFEELHTAAFMPNDWPGKGGTIIGLGVPECELQVAWLEADREPVAVVNRPSNNRRLKYWMRFACEIATERRAWLILTCNTSKQADHAAKLATRRLPDHQRVALERMYDPAARVRGNLS
jgi:hypothetical protein